MKKHFLRTIYAIFLLLTCLGTTQAADTIHMDAVMEIDRHGDGKLTITFRLSASQWGMWKQNYGDRPDVLWRDLRHQFSRYAFDSFDLKKDDITRTATATLTGRALTVVRADGSREVEVGKDFKPISNTARDWVFTATQQATPYTPILSQTAKFILPPEATNAKLHQPGTEYQRIVYEMPETSLRPAMLGGGLGIATLGLVLFALGFVLPGKKPVPVTDVTVINTMPTPPAVQTPTPPADDPPAPLQG